MHTLFAKEKKLPTHSINFVQHNYRLIPSFVPSLFLLSLTFVILCSIPRNWCGCQVVVKYPFDTSLLQVGLTYGSLSVNS